MECVPFARLKARVENKLLQFTALKPNGSPGACFVGYILSYDVPSISFAPNSNAVWANFVPSMTQ